MNEDKACAEEIWHQKRPRCDSHDGNRMNQYGRFDSKLIHRAIPSNTVSAKPIETMSYNLRRTSNDNNQVIRVDSGADRVKQQKV